MTRSESKQDASGSWAPRPVVADALDAEQVADAVRRGAARRDRAPADGAVAGFDPRHFDRTFAATNRLRTEGTDHLLSAGARSGCTRFVAQSYAAGRTRAPAAR